MTCGHDTEPKAVGGAPSVEQFLTHPVPHQPGTHFQYNTMGSYTLSGIVTKVTGQTTLEYLRPRLFEPLGIEHPDWESVSFIRQIRPPKKEAARTAPSLQSPQSG